MQENINAQGGALDDSNRRTVHKKQQYTFVSK
jgi:hypothetical protein